MVGKRNICLTVIETFHQGREAVPLKKRLCNDMMNGHSSWTGMAKIALTDIKVTVVHAEVVSSCLKNLYNLGLHKNRVLFEIILVYLLSMKSFLKLLLLLMSEKI